MAGIEEQPYGIAPAFFEAVSKIANRRFHRPLIRVDMFDDLESEVSQGRCHERSIIGGVSQWGRSVGAVADHQCYPCLGNNWISLRRAQNHNHT